jgi:Ca-activated chloride channel family protein
MNFSLPISISFLYPVFLWLLILVPLFLGLGWPGRSASDRRRRWLALAIRLLIFWGLVLGLAGAQVERPVDTITTVFLLDASDSIRVEDRTRAENFLREALAQKPDDDQAAVILFGGDALVERLPRSEATMPILASVPIKNVTNIERALRLALALLPNEGGHRLVLLSDGQETEGNARRLIDLAAARNVEVSVYPLGIVASSESQAEVLVERVSAPGQARQGQSVPVEVIVTASQPTDATLRLLADGALVESRAVRLVRGNNRFGFNLPLREAGFRRFRAEIEAAEDHRLQNNWGAAFTTVYGPPQLLVVEGQAGEATNLIAALDAAGLTATVINAATLPDTLSALASYDSIILANVPATDLSFATQEALVNFVRDLGRGLVMVGGPESYGAGGYLRSPLEKALPVDMEVRNRSREPNLALVLAVDKSGSMGACHCDNPDLNQTYTRVPSGLPKIDIAKEAILQASAVLGNLDYMGVVSFDSSAHWELDTGPWIGAGAVEQAIGGIAANGQTNIFAGLLAAEEALAVTPARIKHIILLTDGWSRAGAYDDLTARFVEEGITLSVVAAGGGSAEYLAELARKGGGQYYPAATMNEVPQIFLKETIRAVGNYIIEEPFLPVPSVSGGDGSAISPILRGIAPATFPALLGYNGTTPKAAARVALLTPRGDPLLATWQYGLGHSVAWTSDLSGRWAQHWLEWDEFSRFVGQMVNWSLPLPDDEKLDLTASVSGNRAILTAQVSDNSIGAKRASQVIARLIAVDGEIIEAELIPSGANRYQAMVTLPAEGVYLTQVTAYAQDSSNNSKDDLPLASQTIGVVAPYSAEYANLEADPTLLSDLSAATGGQKALSDPAQVFAHNLAIGRQTHPIWPTLLLIAALLFPLDVAIRRLRIGRREWQQVRGWLAGRIPALHLPTTTELSDQPVSSTLRAFRQVQQRIRQQSPSSPSTTDVPQPHTSGPASPAPSRPASTARSSSGHGQVGSPSPPFDDDAKDTLARLRAAKKRARRGPG